jgi:polynucleotide 5'-kinase involved in rRNA processing
MAVKTKQERQSDADKRYRLAHPEKVKEKDRKRYRENTKTERLRNQSYYMQNREAQRIRHRNTRHHITQEWFDAQMAEQDGRCLLCCKPFVKTPHIDHDHRCLFASKELR